MKNIFYVFFTFCISLIFLACASKNTLNSHSQAVQVNMRLANLRLADFGFLYVKQKGADLELYKLAQPLLKLSIKADRICLETACYTKKEFNQKYLGQAYYEDFLEDILRFKPIFNAKNLQNTQTGFIQDIQEQDFSLYYERSKNAYGKDELILKEQRQNISLMIKKVQND